MPRQGGQGQANRRTIQGKKAEKPIDEDRIKRYIYLMPSPQSSNPSEPSRRLAVKIGEAGLGFGADVCLARMTGPHMSRRLDLPSDRDRLLALLAIAADGPISADVIAHLEAASAFWERGDKALANLRLVFAGLPSLDHPADAARVKLAAYCLDQGMAPRVLMKELGLDTSVLDIIKFDPNQPRVPAGSGPHSGRWASGYGLVLAAPASPSLLTTASADLVASFAAFAARFATPTAVLGALIIPTPNSGGVTTGVLPDAPDIAFRKDDPAGTLRLATKTADGSDIAVLAHNQRGLYVDDDSASGLTRA